MMENTCKATTKDAEMRKAQVTNGTLKELLTTSQTDVKKLEARLQEITAIKLKSVEAERDSALAEVAQLKQKQLDMKASIPKGGVGSKLKMFEQGMPVKSEDDGTKTGIYSVYSSLW